MLERHQCEQRFQVSPSGASDSELSSRTSNQSERKEREREQEQDMDRENMYAPQSAYRGVVPRRSPALSERVEICLDAWLRS